MNNVRMPHPGHEKHLCYLQNLGYVKDHLDEYKELVKNGNYVCRACGRVAAIEGSLFVPEKL
jgi:hypothetical protein